MAVTQKFIESLKIPSSLPVDVKLEVIAFPTYKRFPTKGKPVLVRAAQIKVTITNPDGMLEERTIDQTLGKGDVLHLAKGLRAELNITL
jgi:hypothetical protein